jgi:hypothetical protein
VITDEPKFASLLSGKQLRRVEIASKAMCQSREPDDDDENYCAGCDTAEGGTCLAFGLYGDMALAVIEALDRERDSNGK